LDEATKADVDKLIDWGIRTIIDMRDPIETTGVAKEVLAVFIHRELVHQRYGQLTY
jgi:hypothetical protein